jgi:hypothetical protein
MTLPRTVADVLAEHVTFEVECIDRMYLNVWQPRLAYGGGVAGFFTGHRGNAYASTALMDPMSKAFVGDIHHFIAAHGLELVHFARGQRKDEVTQRLLARFTAGEGVLYVGRAQKSRTCGGPSAATTPTAAPTPGWSGPRPSSTSFTSIAWTPTSGRSSSSSAPSAWQGRPSPACLA